MIGLLVLVILIEVALSLAATFALIRFARYLKRKLIKNRSEYMGNL